jgi:drug/metabolite transporter (DMT)-like permease
MRADGTFCAKPSASGAEAAIVGKAIEEGGVSVSAMDARECAAARRLPANPAGSIRQRIESARAAGTRGWRAASANLRGSILMVASIVISSVMMSGIKVIGLRIPLTEILLVRQLTVTLILMYLFRGNLRRALRTSHLGLQVMRGLFSFGSQLTQFLALLYIPLAEVTALGFSQVIFVTIAAAVILRETIGWRRWAATIVGFAGVLVMLRPAGEGLNVFALLAMSSGLLSCGVTITIRSMARTETTATIMLYQSLMLCAAFLIPAALWWETPTPKECAVLLLIGLVGSMGQYFFTSACQTGEAGALAPLRGGYRLFLLS